MVGVVRRGEWVGVVVGCFVGWGVVVGWLMGLDGVDSEG